jgi:hypothetical protein
MTATGATGTVVPLPDLGKCFPTPPSPGRYDAVTLILR